MAGPFGYIGGVEFTPPAPAFNVTISFRGHSISDRGLIDSGSDYTIISRRIANALMLETVGDEDLTGATGDSENSCLHTATVEFLGFRFENFPIHSMKRDDFILIGRDIINSYLVRLNGPSQEFSID